MRLLSRAIKRIAVLLFLLLLWEAVASPQAPMNIPLYIRNLEIRVEVAATAAERAKGLMGRKHLGKDDGMLFIFETEAAHGFWMKNTFLPLSIAFIDRDGKIVAIMDMKPLTLDSHDPPRPILYALEMNEGWFAEHGIRVGDVVRFSR